MCRANAKVSQNQQCSQSSGTRRACACVLRRASICVIGLLTLMPGCVRRTVTIKTAPKGAMVTLNDEKIGTSPVSVDFTWYGDYDVIIQHEGYESLQTHHKIDAPWYQVPPIDFVAEVLVPFEIHDQREASFTLEPAKTVARDKLIEDAKQIRDRTLFEAGDEPE